MSKPERIIVPLTPKQQGVVWRLYGAADIVQELREQAKRGPTGPGFALALALAEKIEAERRVELAQSALRAVAGAGHSIANLDGVYTDIKDGVPVCAIEPPDLFGGEP
ncbi:hypothetical protein [Phreatobacter oligotrophus]|uniref:Uncharacterized protein n=1 Tax=Phreatobacter oligotrophus TaxID=1122261 RepID=A0A2T4ZIQ9_9HYPH|nr:hypothetical protein [Phreatobacter oligotrophus]PTM61867.1 hypothetical protein C8P69_101539 [Phreatobacter oligotrophus]